MLAYMSALAIEADHELTDETEDMILQRLARALDGLPGLSVEFASTPEPMAYRESDDYDVRPWDAQGEN